MRFFIISIMVFTLACERDPIKPDYEELCGTPHWFPHFTLAPETLESFPYSPGEYRYAIFIDSTGHENRLELKGPKSTTLYLVRDRPCEFDSTLIRSYREHWQDYRMHMTDTLLGLHVFLSFLASGETQDTTIITEEDVLLLDVFMEGDSRSTPTLRHQILHKYGPPNYYSIQPRDKVTINGKQFLDVYTHEGDPFLGQYWIGYFNYEIGIVGLRGGPDNISLAFERFE